nr:MAG TPA: hypothetical protein [Caudoviricetes sp.]
MSVFFVLQGNKNIGVAFGNILFKCRGQVIKCFLLLQARHTSNRK